MRQSEGTEADVSTLRRRCIPLRPVTIVLVLLLGACGGGGCDTGDQDVSTDDTTVEETVVEDSSDESGNVEEGDEQSDEQDSEADEGSDDGDGADNGGGDGGELAFADGYDEIVDVMFGDLDDATYDGRSQCLVDPLANQQPVDQLGLRPSNRSHLLADGHDIWVVCSIEAESEIPPDGLLGTLSLVDPNGRAWGEGTLGIDFDNGRTGIRNLGYGQQTDLIEPVGVRSGNLLSPVGSSYLLDGYRVTTIYLEVPVDRPDGQWTVRLDGATDRAVQLETPACNPVDGPVQEPWPIPSGRRIVTWPELLTWIDAAEQVSVPYEPVDHCLATPRVVGLDHSEAASMMSDAIEALGITPTMQIASLVCDDAASSAVVTAQTPVPNEQLRDTYQLTVLTTCPTMPDVVGLTLGDARRTVEELVDPGRGITFRITEGGACVDDNSIVTSTFPSAGRDFFSGNGLQVDLRC